MFDHDQEQSRCIYATAQAAAESPTRTQGLLAQMARLIQDVDDFFVLVEAQMADSAAHCECRREAQVQEGQNARESRHWGCDRRHTGAAVHFRPAMCERSKRAINWRLSLVEEAR